MHTCHFLTGPLFSHCFPLFMNGYILQRMADPIKNKWYTRSLADIPDCLMFVRRVTFELTDYYYNFLSRSSIESGMVNFPSTVKFNNSALHFGDTSTTYESIIKDTSSAQEKLIMSGTFTHVQVSKQTRKPHSYIKSLNIDPMKYPKAMRSPQTIVKSRPSGLIPSVNYTVVKKDIDFNRHTNIFVYIRLFTKCFEVALNESNIIVSEGIEGNTSFVQEFTTDFFKESLLGDVLQVYLWTEGSMIHGQITRGDSPLTQHALLCKLPVLAKSHI